MDLGLFILWEKSFPSFFSLSFPILFFTFSFQATTWKAQILTIPIASFDVMWDVKSLSKLYLSVWLFTTADDWVIKTFPNTSEH